MIKVCFLSIAFPMNKEVINRLRAEMIRIAEMDKHLEFWFFGCHDSFPKKAVQFIQELRDVLSSNQIDIVVPILHILLITLILCPNFHLLVFQPAHMAQDFCIYLML